MTPSFTLLFPTKKLYQCPEWTEYHKARSQYLKDTLTSEYFNQSDKDRWSTLIDAFSKEIQLANWDLFKSKRLDTIVGSYTLSLAEVLSCFEQFYFLWGTDDETFKISSETQRKEFLNILTQILNPNLCEPGIITLIQTLLNTYRSDLDWIIQELSNQRMLIIEKIAVQYNTDHRISNGFEIHTFTHMLKLAAQKSLGIDSHLIKDDAYLNTTSTATINTYFEDMYLFYFKHYEDGIIQNLAQHILYQLQHDPLNTLDVSDWDQQDLILDEEKTVVFFPKLNLFFRHYFIEDELQSILTVSDETNCITLFSKEKLLPIFEKMIEKKLIEEQFFIPIEQLTEENIENTSTLRSKNINLKDLLFFSKQFKSEDNDLYKTRQLLSKNIELIEAYPELILSTLSTHPQYRYAFPRKLQQQFLPYSSTKNDRTQAINELKNTRHLSLLKLKQLSPSISPAQLLAIITHRHDNHLPALPECDENTLKHFISALSLASDGEWSPDYSQFRERTIKTFTPSAQYLSLFNEKYYRQLAETSVIKSNQWLDAYFSFQRQNLIYNKPFSNINPLSDQLQLTAKIYFSFLSSWLQFSSQLLRNISIGLICFYLEQYYTFYFNYYLFSPIFYSIILPGSTTLFLSLWAIQFSVSIAAISYLVLNRFLNLELHIRLIFIFLLYAFFDPYYFIESLLYYEVAILCCYLAASVFTLILAPINNQPWSINTIHHHALNIFGNYFFWPYFILINIIYIFIKDIRSLCIDYPIMIFNCTMSWIGRIIATLLAPSLTIAPTEADALKIKIENNIERLLNTDSFSANIKGDLLNTLWTKIQKEFEGSEDPSALKQALHKKYSFSLYDGANYSNAFIDVAKTHRTNNETFKLDQPKTQYAFFSSKTTTEHELGDDLNHPAPFA